MSSVLGLETQLRTAATRLAQPAPRRRRRWLIACAAASAVTVGGVATAATGLWSPSLGDDHRGHPQASVSAPSAAELATLGVLRRSAETEDRNRVVTGALRYLDPSLSGVRTTWVRYLAVSGSSRSAVLVPAEAAKGRRDPICLFAPDADNGGAFGCWTLAEIQGGQAVLGLGANVPKTSDDDWVRRPDGVMELRHPLSPEDVVGVVMGIVPDGVSDVELPAEGKVPGGKGRVHDNFFAIPGIPPADPEAIRWLDDGGHEIDHS